MKRGKPGWRRTCNAEQFLADLRDYAALLDRYPNVVGATVFTIGQVGIWKDFDCNAIWARVVAEQGASVPPPPPAPPVVVSPVVVPPVLVAPAPVPVPRERLEAWLAELGSIADAARGAAVDADRMAYAIRGMLG